MDPFTKLIFSNDPFAAMTGVILLGCIFFIAIFGIFVLSVLVRR